MSPANAFPFNLRVFSWLRSLYDWCMGWAEHPGGPVALFVLAAAESIFFPLPVDPILIAMGAARPRRALWFALGTTLFSVVGAIVGYALGLWFWGATQDFFFQYVFSHETFNLVLTKFQEHAFLSVFLAGFTPIPFKVFTIAGGVANLALLPFFAGAILGRGLRFCAIGALLYFLGPTIREAIDRYFERITLTLGVAVLVGFIAYQVAF